MHRSTEHCLFRGDQHSTSQLFLYLIKHLNMQTDHEVFQHQKSILKPAAVNIIIINTLCEGLL